jgi:hypothetical protein
MPRISCKQNEFAIAVHNGATYADAYRLAYRADQMLPETVHAEASRLASNHKVAARIEELRLEADALRCLDERQVLTELMKNSIQAREIGNLAASNRALELLGKHLGLWKEQPKTDDSVAALFTWLTQGDCT